LRLNNVFDRYELFIVDLDGVLWRGNELIDGSIETINMLISLGKSVVFMTNNSTKSRATYVDTLKEAGVNEVYVEQVYNSAYALAKYISETKKRVRAFIVGEEGLRRELELVGVKTVCKPYLNIKANIVVVGLDRKLTYRKIAVAVKLIMEGSKYYACNTDATIPLEYGLAPGAGSIVSAISTASGREPEFIAGKPNTYMIDLCLRNYNVEREKVLLIGDRLDTDIKAARRAGIDSALVLTGVTRIEDLKNLENPPTYIIKSLSSICSTAKPLRYYS